MITHSSLISVIIPTWNRSATVVKTIQSVLKQTYQNFEIIVVDDGSTDNTEESVHKINDSRIRYIKVSHSGLPAKVRNIGIRSAGGDWIAFLDSDDKWFPDKLRLQLTYMQKRHLLISTTNGFKKTQNKLALMFSNVPATLTFKVLIITNYIIASSVMINRLLLKDSQTFPENRNYRAFEDWILWLRLSTMSQIGFIDKPLIVYLDDPALSIRKNNEDYIKRLVYLKTDIIRWGVINFFNHPRKKILINSMLSAVKYYFDGEQL